MAAACRHGKAQTMPAGAGVAPIRYWFCKALLLPLFFYLLTIRFQL